MTRKKKVPGPIVPLQAYERIKYECLRCSVLFVSPSGPDPFCVACHAALAARSGSVDR